MVDGTGLGDPMVDELEELGYDVIGLNFTTFKDKMVRLLAKDMEGRQGVHRRRPRGRVRGTPDHADAEGPAVRSARWRATTTSSRRRFQHWGIVMENTPRFT